MYLLHYVIPNLFWFLKQKDQKSLLYNYNLNTVVIETMLSPKKIYYHLKNILVYHLPPVLIY